MSSTDITTDVPTSVAITVIVERSALARSETVLYSVHDVIERSALERSEAVVSVNRRHYHNITEACRGCRRYFRQN